MTTDNTVKLSPVEGIKTSSKGLRGHIVRDVSDQVTGQVSNDEQQLIKFHGIYQQDDRDRREERELKKLEPAYSFMIRLRIPGGDITPHQWLGMQDLADTYCTGTIKITTRQTIQFHGIIKSKLKPTMQWFDRFDLDSIAACGDVNRNVMAGANPATSEFHEEVHAFAASISEHLLPKTNAFYDVWLDGDKLDRKINASEEDTLYKNIYLPRKFKIAIAIPPHNEADVFANDIGLIAIEENGKFAGFNVAIGGGMGCTHGNSETYPRIASIIGFITPEQALDTVWQIAAVQRDNGNRADRKLSRLKYTIDKMELDVFSAEVESRLGFKFAPAKEFNFTARADLFGWLEDHNNKWHYTLFVENGLVKDEGDYRIKSFLKEVATQNICALRFTGNQNIMLLNMDAETKQKTIQLLQAYGIEAKQEATSKTHSAAMACVALNTCPLAMAEGQRYLPEFIEKVEKLLDTHGLKQDEITVRITGCPNGCARPYLAEIGLIGRSLGHYNFHIGGDRLGYRLNTLYKENLNEAEILDNLNSLFAEYASKRQDGESFGDFAHTHYIEKGAA